MDLGDGEAQIHPSSGHAVWVALAVSPLNLFLSLIFKSFIFIYIHIFLTLLYLCLKCNYVLKSPSGSA